MSESSRPWALTLHSGALHSLYPFVLGQRVDGSTGCWSHARAIWRTNHPFLSLSAPPTYLPRRERQGHWEVPQYLSTQAARLARQSQAKPGKPGWGHMGQGMTLALALE